MTENVFQEDRSRLEILEQENIEDMFETEEIFQEDRSRVENLVLENIEDIFVTEEVFHEDRSKLPIWSWKTYKTCLWLKKYSKKKDQD